MSHTVLTETARLRQDNVFRVGAGQGKIKRGELEKASPAVVWNVLRFMKISNDTSKKIRLDSTKEMAQLLRHFSSPIIRTLCTGRYVRYLLCTYCYETFCLRTEQ
jgi:hypothetical protein